MGLCVRVVRGLALCWVVLGGILVGTGIMAVASSDAAVAQTVNSIAVEGNRRVEAETIRSYFQARSQWAAEPRRDRRRAESALRHRPVRGRPYQPSRRPHRGHGGRGAGDQPGCLRGQQEGQRRSTQDGGAIEGARDVVESDRASRRAAHRRDLSAQRPLRRQRRSENHRVAEQPGQPGVRDQGRR